MDTKLGDVLLAAVEKGPAEAGRLITQAIDDSKSSDAVAGSSTDKTTMLEAPTPKAAE